MARSVLEGIGRVVPRLPAGDLEAATDLGVAVDADDLLAVGAPPALEPVGRALQVHPGAAFVAQLTLPGAFGASVALDLGVHVVLSLPPEGQHQPRRPGGRRCNFSTFSTAVRLMV